MTLMGDEPSTNVASHIAIVIWLAMVAALILYVT
jgi:hypothetical protein